MNIWIWGALAFLTALFISLLLGNPTINFLKKAGCAQKIKMDGPAWHEKKSGTPTMGGFIFFSGLVPASILMAFLSGKIGTEFAIVLICATLCGLIGYADDYIKVIKKRNLGLTSGQKFMAQIFVSAAFALVLYNVNGGEILVWNRFFNIGWLIIPVNMVVLLATTNAVNITDGVDGLAGSVSFVSIGFFALSAYLIAGKEALLILLLATMGGILGFLCFNRHPAKVFMGDTGSQFLGGIIGAAACAMGIQLTLILVCFVFMAETLSVIIQVAYAKLNDGKRYFLMTPFHHHLEKKGWSEVKIVRTSVTITVFMGILSALYMIFIV